MNDEGNVSIRRGCDSIKLVWCIYKQSGGNKFNRRNVVALIYLNSGT